MAEAAGKDNQKDSSLPCHDDIEEHIKKRNPKQEGTQ